MVTKLFEASAKKLGLELIVQTELKIQDIEGELFLFIDEGIEGDFSEFLQKNSLVLSCFLHKYSSPKKEGFDIYIRKPFLPTEILDILKPKLVEMGITEATTSDITKDQLEDLSKAALRLRQNSLEDIDDLESLELTSLDDLITDNKAPLVDSKGFEEFDKPNLVEYSLDDLENEEFDLFDKEQEIQTSDKKDEGKTIELESEKMDFDLQAQEEDKPNQDNFIEEEFLKEDIVNLKEDPQEENNLENLESVLEPQDLQNDFEGILDYKDNLSVLDKNQVDEVKKILEQTDNKDISAQKTNTPNQIEDFEGIDEKDIISALSDKEIKDIQPSDVESKKNIPKTNKKRVSKQSSKKPTRKDLDISSLDNIEELIKNMPLETLQTIFNGAQFTINISFPNQKKSNKKK
ncbi:hypothetical protein BKH44_03430 [Helicobacter sp. 13S00477-4]|nr:hypothetical protein BKH44_03430 [Helicobacter sp. 13S00477-4]